ncbi:MAG: endonuclease/exonuclease/phosphatase family protein [Rhodospirillales bacterium]|nr:endonuclease/exonuclease/phosphatase family protein [Rhodospirillales bacterium]
MIAAVAVLLVLCTAAGIVFLVNRLKSPRYGSIPFSGPDHAGPAGTALQIVTWNIGYGSLGAGADFVADGGRSVRALGRRSITTAAGAIGETLERLDADLVLLQEMAAASFLTRGVDVKAGVLRALNGYSVTFWEDFSTRMLPPPFNLSNGMMTLARVAGLQCDVQPLPQEPGFRFGILRKNYGALVTRIPVEDGREWVLMNIHLSAFDDGGNVRSRQVSALLELAQAAYRSGAHVVVGGDWNMRLVDTAFPHGTEEKYLFWIHDFPHEIVPEGWTLGLDPSVPSVRTLHRPYEAGVNYVTVIDGFLVSPNVVVERVETIDLGFLHTDHHPVLASLRMNAAR